MGLFPFVCGGEDNNWPPELKVFYHLRVVTLGILLPPSKGTSVSYTFTIAVKCLSF